MPSSNNHNRPLRRSRRLRGTSAPANPSRISRSGRASAATHELRLVTNNPNNARASALQSSRYLEGDSVLLAELDRGSELLQLRPRRPNRRSARPASDGERQRGGGGRASSTESDIPDAARVLDSVENTSTTTRSLKRLCGNRLVTTCGGRANFKHVFFLRRWSNGESP